VVKTLASGAELLASYKSPDDDPAEAKEMKRIGKKLHLCQNPEKVDLVAVTRAKAAEKREGVDASEEKVLKKRRLERETLEKDGDVFGPNLKSVPR
jgi:cyclin H